jgi:phosphoribosylglycinamide formyltransferase 1
MKNIVIFASGSGSNAENIIQFFENKDKGINVTLVLTNNHSAGVISKARKHNTPCLVFSKQNWTEPTRIIKLLEDQATDFVILAGFMWLVPKQFVTAFKGRILNIHPALLPKFGGKGMYGHFVHEAVKAAGEKETGITIHQVNEHYDEGAVVFQAKVALDDSDNAEDIENKVRALEIAHYPQVIWNTIVK